MLMFWIIFIAILLIGAVITAAVADEVEYRREMKEMREGRRL